MYFNDRTKTLRQRHKRILTRLHGHLSCARSPPIYRHLVCRFFIKTFKIMSISTNIYRPYMCDPLNLYISLVNNSIDQITPYCSTLIYYPHPLIDLLINDQFNPINRLSCQPVVCQATPHIVGDMEYIITHLWNLSVIDYHVCISLVNKSISLITPYWFTLINYPHQHIY